MDCRPCRGLSAPEAPEGQLVSEDAARLAVVIGRVHAEPDDESLPAGHIGNGDFGWMAIFEDGTIERLLSGGVVPPTSEKRR
jgi:hypothetical protein